MPAFITNPIVTSKAIFDSTQRRCNQKKPVLPNFTPNVYSLSTTSSITGNYRQVYINGSNFLSSSSTYVNFGNYAEIPIIYYSSFNISFVIPLDARAGNYVVTVVNVYNGNFNITPENSTNNLIINLSLFFQLLYYYLLFYNPPV
jgi:hypothetical protein